MMNTDIETQALAYAKNGWAIFPCKPDKSPYTQMGFKDASREEEQIKSWWKSFPEAMIGLPTGAINDIWVLDVDVAKKDDDISGPDSLASLIREHDPLPKTLRQKTPSGGEHYIFRMPEKWEVRNRIKFLPGLDVRGDGGYIIFAPSRNAKGTYTIIDNVSPVLAPMWLIELIIKPKKEITLGEFGNNGTGKQLVPYVEKALRNNMEAIANAEVGSRNDTLFKKIAALAEFIPYGFIDEQTLWLHAAQAYAKCNPEDFDKEFKTTFRSAVEHGKQNPREIPANLPPGFRLVRKGNEAGVWFDKPCKNNEGNVTPIRIGAPLVVRGHIRDEESNNWGRLVEWFDPDGVMHSVPLTAEQLTSGDGSWKTVLAQGGYKFRSGKPNVDLLNQYLVESEPVMRFVRANRTGWHNGYFVLPEGAIPKNLMKPMILVNAPKRNPYSLAGTLNEWRESVGKLACGNGRLIFALCIAFAAPLLRLLGQESVGFNFVGSSSIGKSTALSLAASVWGKGSSGDGYVLPWRATDNALEAQAELHSDTLLCLDEMSQASAKVVNEAVYMLGNNQGKARANRKGDSREVKNWRVIFLSSGEQGLEDKLREDGRTTRAGQAVRLIDIPADAGAGLGVFENLHGFSSAAAFAEGLNIACSTYFGTASRAFIARVIELDKSKPNLLQEMFHQYAEAICPGNADGQVKRASAKFALCQVAGQIASLVSNEIGTIMPVNVNEVNEAITNCFAAWLEFRGGSEALEVGQIVERAVSFVETQSSRFEILGNSSPLLGAIPNRAGFKTMDETKTTFYVLPDVFKKEICKGMNPVKAAKVLADKDLLICGEGAHLQCKLPQSVKDMGRPRVYAIEIYDKM